MKTDFLSKHALTEAEVPKQIFRMFTEGILTEKGRKDSMKRYALFVLLASVLFGCGNNSGKMRLQQRARSRRRRAPSLRRCRAG